MNKTTKIYAEVLEPTAIAQFESAMEQDFSVSGALMPDAHTGYSLPIGAVVATDGVIVPAWVGYDIGCGMCAIRLDGVSDTDIMFHSKEIFDRIYETIPVGFNSNKRAMKYSLDGLTAEGIKIATKKSWGKSLCSLGGGNHFIEIGSDEDHNVWIVIHSGSRGVGHGMASHYMTVASSDPAKLAEEFDANNAELAKHNPEGYENYKAKYIAKKMGRLRPKEGHYGFDVSSQEGKDYIQDLNWCLDYALENRKQMILRVMTAIENFTGNPFLTDMDTLINRNHNHATLRDGLWIHRKGATHAEKGMMGVIPGNMRDGSFIVKGKGNPESLYSSSHGAGRVMGRKEAKRKLSMEDFKDTMKSVEALVEEKTLDESPDAYKNIFDVMKLQESLVEVIAHIKPIINIKG